MATEYPGLDAARRGASPETEYLLGLLDAAYAELVDKRREVDILSDQLRFTSEGLERLQRARDGYMEQAVRARGILQHLAHLEELLNGEALLTARVLGEQAREILAKMEASNGK